MDLGGRVVAIANIGGGLFQMKNNENHITEMGTI